MGKILEHTIQSLYGPFSVNQTTTTSANGSKNNIMSAEGPVIYGMDLWKAYCQLVPSIRDRYMAPAGMFNTGTNNLEYSMKYNWNGTARVPRRTIKYHRENIVWRHKVKVIVSNS
ncbi:hypothetical protein ACA910_010701 [Epithemia clementina (nom. ined.)]